MSENDTLPTPEAEPEQPPEQDADLSAADDTLVIAETGEVEVTIEESAEAAADESAPDETTAVEDIPAVEAPVGEDWVLGDIDAALAAVASLSEMMPEREAEAELRADARRSAPTFVPEMQMPPLTTLKRGQIGSVVPALLLIAFGAWLTLTTTSGAPPDPLLVAALIVGGIVVTLLAEWLGTGRWSRGALFFALIVLLFAGVVAFALQPTGIDLGRGYPLLIVAAGLALVLAGVLARPVNARLIAPGALLVLAGVIGLTVTLGLIPNDLLTTAAPLAPVVLVVVLVLWLLPLVFHRRS